MNLRSNLGWLLWLILISLIILSPLLIYVHISHAQEPKNGDISFQPNVIPEVNVYYEDYSFVFEYKSYFIRVRPFVIYNDTYYGMRQIVNFIRNQYPNANYTYLIDKATNAIHYGFNLTRLPQNIVDKIDYLGFRLVDLNFPLSWFKLETIQVVSEDFTPYNLTRIHIKKANLVFSFEDLYPYGYSVEHVNSTYILIGNVKGKTDLYADPITYSSPIITAIGGTQGSPLTFWDIWNASNVNGWNVVHNNNGTNIQYAYQARLQLGNGTVAGTTWLNDTNVELWSSPDLYSANYQSFIQIDDYAHLQLGVPDIVADKTGKDGIMMYHSQHPYSASYGFQLGISAIHYEGESTLEVYASKFYGNRTHTTFQSEIDGDGNLTVWDSLFGNFIFYLLTGGTVDLYDLTFNEGCVFRPYTTSPITIDRITIFDDYRNIQGWYARGYNATNLFQRGGTFQVFSFLAITVDFRFIDADLQGWTFRWGGVNTGEVWRDYTFDLNVTDSSNSPIQNANVTVSHYGEGASQDFTVLTGSNGSFAIQTLTMGFYNQTGGNALYDYNDYNIRITHDDYAIKSFNFTLQEQIKWQISLDTSSYSIGIGSGFILAFMIATVLGLAGIYKIKKR